jgi:hypothetical protein
MRKIVPPLRRATIVVLLLHIVAQAFAQSSATPQVRPYGLNTSDNKSPSAGRALSPATPPTTIAKNIVSDFRAKCNGVANDTPSFVAFNAWARRQTLPITLTIPSGSVCMLNSSFAKGIKKLLVLGYGATIKENNAAGNGFFLGGRGVFQDNRHSSRLATVAAGTAKVTLLAPGESSRFTVGGWALIAGFDLQGYGYPPNPHFFEYVQITAINPAIGEITFAAPLKNGYKSTWPLNWSGSALEADQGGPATLYALDPTWDTEVEYRGLTIARPEAQTYANGRSITYRDVTFTGQFCGVPTQNLVWQAIDTDMSDCFMEADKLVGTIVLDGVTIRSIVFQSSSIDLLSMTRSAVTVSLNGTPKRALISDSTIRTLKPGAIAYGRSDEVVCTNCIISDIIPGGVLEKGDPEIGVNNAYSMSNGIIMVPHSLGAVRWAVPGTNLFWSGRYQTEGSFSIVDVTQDVDNTYVQTTLSSGFPPVPLYDGKLNILVHPAPKFTCTNCRGSAVAVDLSQAPAGAPLYSYSKRTYTGGTSWTSAPTFEIWGAVSSVKFNVAKPYTGVLGTLLLNAFGQFNNYPTIKADSSVFTYGPIINLKAASERVVTPSEVTGTQTGDNGLGVPEPVWFTGTTSPSISSDVSQEASSVWPNITIEITTDQRVVSQ